MGLPHPSAQNQPLRKTAQRLRWFIDAFEKQVEDIEARTGNRFTVDRAVLARVFAEWLKAFEAQKPARDEDKLAYVGFAAGLMLKTLIANNPVALSARGPAADESKPAYFWPEGYLYVAFCLNARGLVLEVDYHAKQQPSGALEETRTWWSFRENVADDPSLAIAFLDLFAGDEPEWSMPELFRSGRVKKIAKRYYLPDGDVLQP